MTTPALNVEPAAEAEGSGLGKSTAPSERVDHFWVASSPFFETELLAYSLRQDGGGSPLRLVVHDPDGSVINEILMVLPAGRAELISLQSTLEACKLEAGLHHGYIAAHHSPDIILHARMQSRDASAALFPSQQLSNTQSVFFPVSFSAARSYLVCIVNPTEKETQVRVRLFYGKRTPESIKTVPAHGARIVSLTAEFAEYLNYESGKLVQAYVRLTTREAQTLGAQLIERTEVAKEHFLYTSVG